MNQEAGANWGFMPLIVPISPENIAECSIA
jgi:hypothetical protein